MDNYEDIINLPHHQSERRAHMTNHARAAQFAPFAALTGYDALVNEAARYVDKKIELDEDVKSSIDLELQIIREHLSEYPEVTITYFVKDERKPGGTYITTKGIAKKIDDENMSIKVDDTVIKYVDILSLKAKPIM